MIKYPLAVATAARPKYKPPRAVAVTFWYGVNTIAVSADSAVSFAGVGYKAIKKKRQIRTLNTYFGVAKLTATLTRLCG